MTKRSICTFALFSVFSGTVCAPSRAQDLLAPICDSVETCRAFEEMDQLHLARVRARLQLLSHRGPARGEVVRRMDYGCPTFDAANPAPCGMTPTQGRDYCLNLNLEHEQGAIRTALGNHEIPERGIYLPTIQELATEIYPAGVSSTPGDRFDPITLENGNVSFYYNRDRFPLHRDGAWYWSSSFQGVDLGSVYGVVPVALGMSTYDGNINTGNGFDDLGRVRCMMR